MPVSNPVVNNTRYNADTPVSIAYPHVSITNTEGTTVTIHTSRYDIFGNLIDTRERLEALTNERTRDLIEYLSYSPADFRFDDRTDSIVLASFDTLDHDYLNISNYEVALARWSHLPYINFRWIPYAHQMMLDLTEEIPFDPTSSSNELAVILAQIEEFLLSYPVLDEEDWSRREYEGHMNDFEYETSLLLGDLLPSEEAKERAYQYFMDCFYGTHDGGYVDPDEVKICWQHAGVIK